MADALLGESELKKGGDVDKSDPAQATY